MGMPTERENIQAGMDRLEELVGSFDPSLLEEAGDAAFADRIRRQPWLIAGVSDGMGLHVTLAAIEAGLIEQGVGVYYEPPALLEFDEGEPVSPVHFARYQNALALEEYASERGVDLEVLSADMVLAPQRGLKGDVKGEIPEVPEEVREAVRGARSRASESDIVFIDSVAFGKWISPREGMEPVSVPSVDFQGRIIETETKSYHPRGYQETLDTMGRNHGRLLERFREFGWLGEQALTAFFTWAGGSQNVEVLEGIYGRGSLGDAKIIAERDVVEFRLEHGLELGEHAIVRLPAFLSAALMGIPGAGLFGLISRKELTDRGVYRDMPELAARMLRRLFDTEWVRTNPIAQIELDSNEVLHMSEISERVEEAHERIAAYRENQPEEERGEPIPVEKSEELLEGFVPWNYRDILGRFRPEEGSEAEATTRSFEFDVAPTPFRDHLRAPVASTFIAALPAIDNVVASAGAEGTPKWIRDEFETDAAVETGALDVERTDRGPFRGRVELDAEAEEGAWRVRRVVFDGDGRRVGRGTTTIGWEEPSFEPTVDSLGEPAGSRVEVARDAASAFLEEGVVGDEAEDLLQQAGALGGFAEAALLASGRTDGSAGSTRWEARLDQLPGADARILTYARREGHHLEATVVDERGEPLATLRYRDESEGSA